MKIPVYWGNRNWDPYLSDAMAQMKADGVSRVAALLTSAYSSYSGCRQYREDLAAAVGGGAGGAEDRPAAGLLQPPGLHRADGGRDPGRARRPAGGGTPRRPPRLRHALDPGGHERGERTAGWGLRGAAPGRRHRDRRARPRGDRPPLPLRPRLLLTVGAAAGAVARARRQRPPASPAPPGRAGGRRGADRLRLRPHGGRLRPRHRGAGDGRGARPALRAGRDRRGRPALRGDGARPAPRAQRGRAGRDRRPGPRWARSRRGTCAPAGCCPNPRGPRPALCGRD